MSSTLLNSLRNNGNDQFGRAYQLALINSAESLDVSQLRFKFQVNSMDLETPNTAVIRVYNLSKNTVDRIVGREFTGIVLQAGYQNNVNYGIIFKGDIKHIYQGRESNVDSYIEIRAADGDLLYNFGVSNTNVGPGSTPQQRFNAVMASVGTYSAALGITVSPTAESAFANTGGVLPQGAVLFGMWRSMMRQLASSANARWSIQNGVVTVISNSGYLPGEAVVLNSQSGLVGTPEVTDSGVNVKMLLNARLRIGGLVNINQALINKQLVLQQGFPSYNSLYFPAQTTSDGNYRVLVMNHEGDTRGISWHTTIVGLALPVQTYPN